MKSEATTPQSSSQLNDNKGLTNAEEQNDDDVLIPDEDCVYRQAHTSQLDKREAPRRVPKDKDFKPGQDGLSVYWDRLIDVQGVYMTIGLSYRSNTEEYKQITNFTVYKMPVVGINAINGIQKVVHAPTHYGTPAPVGQPNIYAHSLVKYPDEPEIRIKLRDLIANDYDTCLCKCNIELLEDEVNKLRERLNDTPYHQ